MVDRERYTTRWKKDEKLKKKIDLNFLHIWSKIFCSLLNFFLSFFNLCRFILTVRKHASHIVCNKKKRLYLARILGTRIKAWIPTLYKWHYQIKTWTKWKKNKWKKTFSHRHRTMQRTSRTLKFRMPIVEDTYHSFWSELSIKKK